MQSLKKIHAWAQMKVPLSHAFSDHQDFILLVRTVTIFSKIIFNSSYTEINNHFFTVLTNTR